MTEDTTVKNLNPYDLIDHNDQDQEEGTANTEEKKSESFFKKIINAFKKTGGNGSPEKKDSNIDEKNDALIQNTPIQEGEEKKKINFENVMSGVTGVLNKIEKKVGEKTGLNSDAPLKKREEEPQQEAEKNKTEATPSTTETTNEPAPENEVEKNNEEYLSENH